jgi:hypothetical protein
MHSVVEGLAANWCSFGAVAYSQSTGRWGCSWNLTSPDLALQAAIADCGPGAEGLTWGRHIYIALAVASNGAAAADASATPKYAKRHALRKCQGPNARIILVVQTLWGIKEQTARPPLSTATPTPQSSVGNDYKLFVQRTGYGAIAVSPRSGLYSYVAHQSSIEDAELAAVRNCRQNPAATDAVPRALPGSQVSAGLLCPPRVGPKRAACAPVACRAGW